MYLTNSQSAVNTGKLVITINNEAIAPMSVCIIVPETLFCQNIKFSQSS
ncbi:MAG: hypothetical protein V7K90_11285 [Nostoc sp.]